MNHLPVMRPIMPSPAHVLGRLDSVGRAGVFSNFGPQVIELEERLSAHVDCSPDQLVTCSSATTGLTGAVTLSPATTWQVPAFTFTATPAAVLMASQQIEWWDIDPTSWWAASASEPPAMSSGLVPVAPFGAAVDLDRFDPAREVVVDAAASTGACNPPLSGLPKSWAVVFSLHATKVLPSGEGGFVVFGDPERAQAFRSWSNFGFAGTRESIVRGTNAKMSEHTAAWAHASLDGWETEREEWAYARALVGSIASELGLETFVPSGAESNPYWIVRFASADIRNSVERHLALSRIGTRRWWGDGCHRMGAYRDASDAPVPVTDMVAGRYLGLPFFRRMTEAQGASIQAALESALIEATE